MPLNRSMLAREMANITFWHSKIAKIGFSCLQCTHLVYYFTVHLVVYFILADCQYYLRYGQITTFIHPDCIVDVRVTDTDAPSYQSRDPIKVLETQEREKKRKYLEPCLAQRRHFTPFVMSVDGLLGKEGDFFIRRLAGRLSTKWQRPYSMVKGFVTTRISVAAIRGASLCVRGSRVPADQISCRRHQWEDGAGLGLFR